MVGIAIICGSLFIFRINISWFNANIKNSIEKFIFNIIVHLIYYVNIVPVLMISSNEKITVYVKNKFIWFNVVNQI